jgi:hypothetical protein
MRIELRLILWVTALAMFSLVIFRGFSQAPSLTLPDIERDGAEASESLHRVATITPAPERRDELLLPEIDAAARPMFEIVAGIPEPMIVEVERPVEVYPPKLKGIVEQGGRFLAVFSEGSGDSPYSVVGVGDSVQGYRVRAIESDHVAAESSSRETVIFKLRGAGELP